MSRLTLIENNDGLEFHINEETNIAYASVRATARMVGKEDVTIRRWIGATLLTSEQVFEAALKWLPELAKKMGACGANVFMLGMAGYEVNVYAASGELDEAILEFFDHG